MAVPRATKAPAVAPFTGAWVEIKISSCRIRRILSLPSRKRGLKLIGPVPIYCQNRSLPSRERGLKYFARTPRPDRAQSLPSRERGLKFPHDHSRAGRLEVAPFTGAWVEIATLSSIISV